MGYEEEDRRAEGAAVHQARPRHGVGECPPSPSQREVEVDRVSGAITALTDAGGLPARLDAAFDVYQTGLLARTQVETRRIKEVSQ
jgi:hypothetical protein